MGDRKIMQRVCWIYDFCNHWDQISHLKVVSGCSDLTFRVKWNKWLKNSLINNYSIKIFGIKIREAGKQENERNHNTTFQDSLLEKLKWKEHAKRALELQICYRLVDLIVNLQWSSCFRVY